ncbi:iron-containing redox enzyme family protein [Streptomyces sp. ISL-11]|uniref:iron-containing redox enzyme family protein n=1 Tax=Streptomyces sp. ISL-11 TaxID=2819174 RepID=UPI001BE569F0|nr:iron-containing redox enzyme family protein [Streptomyces sp. ISL-11]MBT2386592.1 iron-containing redox enzyme family protein [Streptomyces sp. ISL-11]
MPEPPARGEISAALLHTLSQAPADGPPLPGRRTVEAADPYGEDLQLALYACYELHYRGWPGASDAWEWNAELLRLRALLEEAFHGALRSDVPAGGGWEAALESLVVEPADGKGASFFLRERGTLGQMREYAAHRSLYQLKEADPHAWMIPRLTGRAKAALVAVEYDEYGAGRAERIHAGLFAALMRDLGLADAGNHYLPLVPAVTLATVNVMSLFGLHRAHRGHLAGHFALLESASPPASRRLVQALTRLDAGPAAVHFYREHAEADAVHEQLVRHGVIGGLLQDEPHLADDVAFGIEATRWLEDRLEDHLTTAWEAGVPSLRAALPAGPGPARPTPIGM